MEIDKYIDNKYYNNPISRIAIHKDEDFDYLCEILCYEQQKILAVDEIDFFDNPYKTCDNFLKMIHYNRHYKNDIFSTTRRPARISRDLTSQSDKFILFRVTENRDLEYIKNINETLAEKVKILKNYEYIQYDF